MDKYSKIVQNLLASGIKLVAVDFDLTILNVHTRGFWQFTSKMLATRVRPCFQKFLTVAVNSDLHVAIVTQSPQVSLVQEVMEQTLPDCDTGRIVIRGADGTWKMLKGVSKEGKQQHIESAIKYLEKTRKAKISAKNVILIDDDITNLEIAKSSKMHTLQIIDDDSLDALLDQRDSTWYT
ncbi:uncharacterized protein LOC110231704 [Exaiptasia diaphana]|uniref:Uncharacterized protein n=1 Tax=Exaiptasia diaphana TaxID=2652724 RepID=A0A913WQ51_EXADI|nr:uncharacterized protein LOC110231704 [Exaiptasia diaphana]KXJ18869.1 hypothetical protein AC249_AIPGENE20161 [Exaiptasia diaphana]